MKMISVELDRKSKCKFKVIDSVSADGTVVTLTEPLKYKHLSIMQTFGSHDIEVRASHFFLHLSLPEICFHPDSRRGWPVDQEHQGEGQCEPSVCH